ncbi:hypothetical protein PUNSTDRAFT_53415 [Punctularia strigosozonata HHB-11173 SS5]|uniref:uncharacterized protein n=1 Tax=Punctularia strigosozonata (strain HHB-11173) TaxID=741275 RepID=UPI00044165DA|nr:uncharacterized protein PUNSTDRAFT_53415 [Punctularia strigosozonata HHB-11173 SS5]EIN06995.1 hypothetical protein PUNSTDRAFT_53415 [Punctularia strigosozonata HHB-11173 SS5]
MFTILARAAAAAILVGPTLTNAFWILSHGSLTHDRLDPLLSSGKVSTHEHTVVGASNFGPVTTYDSLQSSECTTSPVQADKSNYWAPQLYHRNQENNTYTLIPISFVQTYYLNRDGPTQKTIKGFPKGLRMLAGNMARTTYNASSVEDLAVSFVCLDYNAPATGNQNTLPTTQCPDGMRAQIVFPSCWDGVNLDSADHKSHMSYPIGGAPDSGDCPSSHPIKLITLFNEWVFDVGKFDFVSGQKNWVFSYGDEEGLGFHADFINGWDTDVLEAAVEQCTGNLFGDLESCPPFTASLNRTKAGSCTTPPVVEENTQGPLTSLPGCNPVPYTASAQCPNLATPAIKGFSGGSSASASASVSISSSSAHTSTVLSASSTAIAASDATSASSVAAHPTSVASSHTASASTVRSASSTAIAASDVSSAHAHHTFSVHHGHSSVQPHATASAIVQVAAPSASSTASSSSCKVKRADSRRSRTNVNAASHRRRYNLQRASDLSN